MSENESGSSSGSESEPEFESIIATRARRSNAGSRLRQLLDLEETSTGFGAINEEDENVNLLFMEDEDDQEFAGSENDEENEVEEDQSSDDGKQASGKAASRPDTAAEDVGGESNDSGEVSAANSDEMLSDTDMSGSETDEEEGERELQKQERLSKRRKRNNGLPTAAFQRKIKGAVSDGKAQPPKKAPAKASKPFAANTAPIVPSSRRHSSRRTTIQNSIATNEKLEKEYEKRQTQVPVAKKEYIEKTLEERLEEAKITERENTLSLTRFYEQEVQKKKKQRDLANSRKFKLKNFIRLWSTGVFVTPADEIHEIEEEQKKIAEEEEKRTKRKLLYQKRKQARLGTKGTVAGSEDVKEQKGNGCVTVTEEQQENGTQEILKIESEDVERDQKEKAKVVDGLAMPAEEENLEKMAIDQEQAVEDQSKGATKNVHFDEAVTVLRDTSAEKVEKLSDELNPLTSNDKENTELANGEHKTDNDGNIETGEEDGVSEQSKMPQNVYEGPPQHVTRNYVIFEEFDDIISIDDMKKYLFGQQSILTGTRRDPNCETICIIKQDESSNIDLQKIQAARDESFKLLINLPKFGETVQLKSDSDGKSNTEEEEVVQIHTPAPIGIHLPNGKKKMCLTTGQPAMYYDPASGVPYATVDSFRVLKSIVAGEYQWLQLDNGGINSRYAGGIGCYIGKKNQRHAKGVPDGF